MKLYTCIDHAGHNPVPKASIVIANDETQAKELLDKELFEHGLDTSIDHPYTLQEVKKSKPIAIVLSDGEY